MKKKFVDTKVGAFLKKNAPHVLEVIGDNLPIPHALTKMITGIITPENKDEAETALAEYTETDYAFLLAEQKEITDRWKADMGSDSKLSKNVRPIVLLYLLGMITVFILLDSLNMRFHVNEHWIGLIETLSSLVFVAYFGGRTGEKITQTRNKK